MRIKLSSDEIIGGVKVPAGTTVEGTTANIDEILALAAMGRAAEGSSVQITPGSDVALAVADARAKSGGNGVRLTSGVVPGGAPAGTVLARVQSAIAGVLTLIDDAAGAVALVGRNIVSTASPMAVASKFAIVVGIGGISQGFTLVTPPTYTAPIVSPLPTLPGAGDGTAPTFTTNTHVTCNTRMQFSARRIQTGIELHFGSIMVEKTPEWNSRCPRLWFAGFLGEVGKGEILLGGDKIYSGVFIEINDVKYWLSADGSNTFSTTRSDAVHKFTVPNGGYKLIDPDIPLDLPKNTFIRFGWEVGIPAGGYYEDAVRQMPLSVHSTASGRGDYAVANITAAPMLTAIQNNTTAVNTTVPSLSNFNCPPVNWTSKPATPADAALARAALVAGHSVDYGLNVTNSPYALDTAHPLPGDLNYGLLDPTNGRIPVLNLAVSGSRIRDLTNAGDGAANAANGWAMRHAMCQAGGFPWSTAIISLPINDTFYGGQQTVDGLALAIPEMVARGNRRVVMITGRPQSTNTTQATGANNNYFTTGGPAYQIQANIPAFNQVLAYIQSVPPGVSAVIDTLSALEVTGHKWGAPAGGTTLAQPAYGPPSGVVGSVSGNTLTVESITGGTIAIGQRLKVASNANDQNFVTGFGTGTGGTGTYTVSNPNNRAFASGTAIPMTGQLMATLTDPSVVVKNGDFFAVNPGPTIGQGQIFDNAVLRSGSTNSFDGSEMVRDYPAGTPVLPIYTNDNTHLSPQGARASAGPIIAAKAAGGAIR